MPVMTNVFIGNRFGWKGDSRGFGRGGVLGRTRGNGGGEGGGGVSSNEEGVIREEYANVLVSESYDDAFRDKRFRDEIKLKEGLNERLTRFTIFRSPIFRYGN